MAEIWVAKGTYKPDLSNIYKSFVLQTGHQLYGGLAGTEKSINQRNLALLATTNATTLSGDLNDNDLLSDFDNYRGDNSNIVVTILSKG